MPCSRIGNEARKGDVAHSAITRSASAAEDSATTSAKYVRPASLSDASTISVISLTAAERWPDCPGSGPMLTKLSSTKSPSAGVIMIRLLASSVAADTSEAAVT
jgi:hypothetical protein